jgi:hypothetical protein
MTATATGSFEVEAMRPAYLGASPKFDRAMAAFAESYADQNERDHAALREAVASGRVEAVEGL